MPEPIRDAPGGPNPILSREGKPSRTVLPNDAVHRSHPWVSGKNDVYAEGSEGRRATVDGKISFAPWGQDGDEVRFLSSGTGVT